LRVAGVFDLVSVNKAFKKINVWQIVYGISHSGSGLNTE
jgi:hypothetical protein